MKKIIEELRIVARDQNKVFVEKAEARKLSPNDAIEKYGLLRGRANAYVEFDVEPERLMWQKNSELKIVEWFVRGDVDLTDRDAVPFYNI